MLTTLKKTLKTCLLLLFVFSAASKAQLLDTSPDAPASVNSGSLLDSGNSSLATAALQSVLPAASAFALNAYIESPSTVVLNWEIEDGYYMYRKSLQFTELNGDSLDNPIIPAGIQIEDEFFGAVEVYYQRLLIRIPFDPDNTGDSISLQLTYQGCAEDNYCYPMQFKEISLEII